MMKTLFKQRKMTIKQELGKAGGIPIVLTTGIDYVVYDLHFHLFLVGDAFFETYTEEEALAFFDCVTMSSLK